MKKILTGLLTITILFTLIQCDGTRSEQITEISTVITKQDTLPLTNSWEMAIPNQSVPQGLTSLSSNYCGSCHTEHYKEWKLSTHSHAWTDKQFQAELKKDSSPLLCINCHIPLQNQQEYIVTGLINGDIYQPVKKKNPHFDKELQQEGINCASCHVRDGAIIGPTGTTKAPHKTVKGNAHLSESLCIGCHNAVERVSTTLVCTFETGDEWRNGPYKGKDNCISCHMPELNREVVAGYGKRKSTRHYFSGSGIPKVTGLKSIIMNGLEFYPSPLKKVYKVNSEINFTFKTVNASAGHNVPTGDPERFIIFQFQLIKDGKIIAEQKERIGEKWEWHPKAEKLADNNIKPLEERVFSFNPRVISKGNYVLKMLVNKHRLDKKSADYNKLGDDYPLFITIFEREEQFVVE